MKPGFVATIPNDDVIVRFQNMAEHNRGENLDLQEVITIAKSHYLVQYSHIFCPCVVCGIVVPMCHKFELVFLYRHRCRNSVASLLIYSLQVQIISRFE